MSVTTKKIEAQEAGRRPEVHVINERCAGCEECVIRCPARALSLDRITWLAVADNQLCTGCRRCVRACPFSAITVDGPVLVPKRAAPGTN